MNNSMTVVKLVASKCYNCNFASKGFKIGKRTHYHCNEPKRVEESISAWDTLENFYGSCNKHKPKK